MELECKQTFSRLEGLEVNQVISLLKSWKLDSIMANTFRRQHVDGDALACMEEGDFDEADFPLAKKFHWKKFWKKLDDAKENGVPNGPSVDPPQPIEPPEGEDTPNHKPWLLKTEICKVHARTGSCMYGENCRFAHGLLELRFVKRHPRYKTRKCVNFWNRNYCAYGDRCCFIHDEYRQAERIHGSRHLDRPADRNPVPTLMAPQVTMNTPGAIAATMTPPTTMPPSTSTPMAPRPDLSPPAATWRDQQVPTHPIWSTESASASASWNNNFGQQNPWSNNWATAFPRNAIPQSADVDTLATTFDHSLDISASTPAPAVDPSARHAMDSADM